MLLSMIAGAAGVVGDGFDLDKPNWWIVGAATVGGVASALVMTRWRPTDGLGRPHAGPGDAVGIARFTDAEIVLRCYNDGFAAKVIEANPGAAYSRAA